MTFETLNRSPTEWLSPGIVITKKAGLSRLSGIPDNRDNPAFFVITNVIYKVWFIYI